MRYTGIKKNLIMKNPIVPEYRTSQAVLYSLLLTAWSNCLLLLGDFTAVKGFYLAAYVAAAKAEVVAARNLPNEEERGSVSQADRVQLVKRLNKCLRNFRVLKLYIKTAFAEDLVDIKIQEAGGIYYALASNENWASAVLLNTTMMHFINTYSVELLAGNNMPAGFEALVIADAGTFETDYETYKSDAQTTDETDEKIVANNAVYKKAMLMMEDGKVIFEEDPGKQKMFELTALLDLIAPPGSASLTVDVLVEGENKAAVGLSVDIQADGGVVLHDETDANGEAHFLNTPPTDYHYTISGVGFETVQGSKTIGVGIAARFEVKVVRV